MPKVSVIIPAYNAMDFLPETLKSVLCQTFTDFEVLIVNDGSSDGIVEWVAQIQDVRVQFISQENQGPSVARNTGIWKSQGEYLAFLDADDIWEPTKLEKQTQCLEQNLDIGLIGCWMAHIDENSNILDVGNSPKYEGIELKRELFIYNIILCGSTPMVRRSCFEKVGFFEHSIRGAEDWDMWLRIAKYYSISVIQEPLVRYRQHSNNLSNNLRSMLHACDKATKRAFEFPPPGFKRLKGVGTSQMCVDYLWVCLLEKNDFHEAFWFAKQAFIRRPNLIFSQSHVRIFLSLLKRELRNKVNSREKIISPHSVK